MMQTVGEVSSSNPGTMLTKYHVMGDFPDLRLMFLCTPGYFVPAPCALKAEVDDADKHRMSDDLPTQATMFASIW